MQQPFDYQQSGSRHSTDQATQSRFSERDVANSMLNSLRAASRLPMFSELSENGTS